MVVQLLSLTRWPLLSQAQITISLPGCFFPLRVMVRIVVGMVLRMVVRMVVMMVVRMMVMMWVMDVVADGDKDWNPYQPITSHTYLYQPIQTHATPCQPLPTL